MSDKLDFEFSEVATKNIQYLLKLIKLRLASSGKTKSNDAEGNVIYIDCDIFAVDQLVGFFVLALSDFNQTPYFSNFTFEDTRFILTFAEILVSGATLYALGSKALIERGREFQYTNDGIVFTPPNVSDLLQTQYSQLIVSHMEKLRNIKLNIKDFNKD